MAIKQKKVTEIFNGQALIALFDEPTGGYTENTSFADVTASGIDLGQVVEDSTSWDGDEPSIDHIRDEQGESIVANVTAGTYAFSCDVADLSIEMVEQLLKGTKVTLGTSASIEGVSDAVKLVELPVQTRPIAIFNDQANKWIMFPKAKIVGSLTLDSKLWRIHLNATAEYLDTETLGTCTFGKGKPKFGTTTAA